MNDIKKKVFIKKANRCIKTKKVANLIQIKTLKKSMLKKNKTQTNNSDYKRPENYAVDNVENSAKISANEVLREASCVICSKKKIKKQKIDFNFYKNVKAQSAVVYNDKNTDIKNNYARKKLVDGQTIKAIILNENNIINEDINTNVQVNKDKPRNVGQVIKTKESYLRSQNINLSGKIKTKAYYSSERISKQNNKIGIKKHSTLKFKSPKHVINKSTLKVSRQTARLTTRVARLIAKATAKIISQIAIYGGWSVLLIVLIVIIIMAALAASPFGIYISQDINDGIPIAEIMAECNNEFTQKIEKIEDKYTYDTEETEGSMADWGEILAVFAVKTAGGDENALDVVVIDEHKKNILKDIFFDMNSVSEGVETIDESKVLKICIESKTAVIMADEYNFSTKQREALDALLNDRDMLKLSSESLVITDSDAKDIINNLPENLDPTRRKIVINACSLIGKVNYFWGGRSFTIGWDSRWGQLTQVTASGSKSTGTMRPFGLDCSGFVLWAFYNSGISPDKVGGTAREQAGKCTRIPWSEVQPGDLAFFNDLTHVGIVCGGDSNGNVLIVHCSSSKNVVVVGNGSSFGFAARLEMH